MMCRIVGWEKRGWCHKRDMIGRQQGRNGRGVERERRLSEGQQEVLFQQIAAAAAAVVVVVGAAVVVVIVADVSLSCL